MGFGMVKELSFYHNKCLNYDQSNALWSDVANMRKIGLKIVFL